MKKIISSILLTTVLFTGTVASTQIEDTHKSLENVKIIRMLKGATLVDPEPEK